MVRISLSIVLMIFLSINSFSQKIYYELQVYKKITFGEYNPTGKYSVFLYNENGKKVAEYQSGKEGYNNHGSIVYYIYHDKPILFVNNEPDKPITFKQDQNYVNEIIDTLFNFLKDVIQTNNIRFNSNKNNVITEINSIFKNDTLHHIINNNCYRWDFRISDDPIIYSCRVQPLESYLYKLSNNEIYEYHYYSYDRRIDKIEDKYFKEITEWNIDSTIKSKKAFNINNQIIYKNDTKYDKDNDEVSIFNYLRNNQKILGETTKKLSPNVTESVKYFNDQPASKTIKNVNEFGDIIEEKYYSRNPTNIENPFRLNRNVSYDIDYDQKGRIKQVSVKDRNNNEMHRIEYFYGKNY